MGIKKKKYEKKEKRGAEGAKSCPRNVNQCGFGHMTTSS